MIQARLWIKDPYGMVEPYQIVALPRLQFDYRVAVASMPHWWALEDLSPHIEMHIFWLVSLRPGQDESYDYIYEWGT